MMLAMRRMRRFSTAAPRKEYPTSFLSHLRTQKLNVFNIGVAFLTLSLSSQLVTSKQKLEKAEEHKSALADKVSVLEKMVVELGGTLPEDAELAAATAADKDKEAQAKREREEEAKALAAMTAPASADDKKPKKGMLI